MAFKLSWVSLLKISLLLALIAAFIIACFTLPIEKILKDFLVWIQEDLGPWGPLVLAVAYIPLTVLAVPASVLTLGGGYLFGLPVGFIADSVGATIGAGAAFLLGRTIGRSYVISKLKDYPKFRAVAIAIRRSGFKIVLLLRLVPLLPFNMLNYLLSVTPVPIAQYMLASWLGMMPITFALVYVGTTLKDLSDVTHGWHDFSKTRWSCPYIARRLGRIFLCMLYALCSVPRPLRKLPSLVDYPDDVCNCLTRHTVIESLVLLYAYAFILIGLVVSVLLMICVTRVAKAALEKALAENEDVDADFLSPHLPIKAGPAVNLHDPLIIKIDTDEGIR
ncbi:UNVERIFIED_CONTAM: TVP38/TMEM64 family membrane protein [Sesamum calycinum]|uniref:TVP38/TMEM64 family membrane protein n=1 Tax=Sesamum calycinum TaxID=2727403 RepID=A0AAW2R8U0_9LAMI